MIEIDHGPNKEGSPTGRLQARLIPLAHEQLTDNEFLTKYQRIIGDFENAGARFAAMLELRQALFPGQIIMTLDSMVPETVAEVANGDDVARPVLLPVPETWRILPEQYAFAWHVSTIEHPSGVPVMLGTPVGLAAIELFRAEQIAARQ